jgi:hypothetical protein
VLLASPASSTLLRGFYQGRVRIRFRRLFLPTNRLRSLSGRGVRDYLILSFGEDHLDEVAVGICSLRREHQLNQAGPVRLRLQDRAFGARRDGSARRRCSRRRQWCEPARFACAVSLSR